MAAALVAAPAWAAPQDAPEGSATPAPPQATDPAVEPAAPPQQPPRTPAEVAAARRAAWDGVVELPAQRGAPRGERIGGANRTETTIRARLDDDGRTLTGELEVVWTNGSEDPVDDLFFHVYLNGFANDRSTKARSDGDVARRLAEVDQKGTGFGFTDVTGVWLLEGGGERDLLPTLRYPHEDGNTDDRTVFSVDLPSALGLGEKARVRVAWTSRLPRAVRRTGQKDDFLFVAQWFPKLGVYEARRGWNAHPFHAFTEWYADFGTYDVTLDLPLAYEGKVGGSGVDVSSERTGERVVVHFLAPSAKDRDRPDVERRSPLVHDFAWTADPDYVTYRSTFRFADWAQRFPHEVERARAAFGSDARLELRDVEVLVFLQPEREAQGPRHAEATEAALFFYGLWYGEYPYERITVVDPAWGSRSGGMEYPTLFTAGTRLLSRPSMHVPESVTVHEAGHQWFFGMVANNEFEAAWMDEGLNSYTDSEVIARVWGPRVDTTTYSGIPVDGVRLAPSGGGSLARAIGLREVPLSWLGIGALPSLSPLGGSGFLDWWRDQPWSTSAPSLEDPRWNDRTRYLSSPDKDPIDTIAWHALDRSSHYTNTYSRTAVALRSLPAAIEHSAPGTDGWAAFHRGMRAYALAWRFRHPYPDDFFAALQRGIGVDVDLSWYFEELFRGTGTVDWSIEVEQRREREPVGYFQGPDGRWAEAADAGEANGAPEERAPRRHEVEVIVRRRGELALPVPVRLVFEDGTEERFVWTREQQLEREWLRWRKRTSSELVSAAVDPDRTYLLDADLSNNQWHAERDARTPWRWAERAAAQFMRDVVFNSRVGG